MTIGQVKDKFRTHIGTHAEHQRLILKIDGRQVCEMNDDSKMLGFYSVQSGNEIHVIDTDPFSLSRGGGLTDTSLIEKYKMEDEVYDKRAGTMREFIREQRKKDPNFKLKPKSTGPGAAGTAGTATAAGGGGPQVSGVDGVSLPAEVPGLESVEGIEVGMRCQATPGARRGTVMFVGEIEEIKSGGYWVGIKLDEPSGSNDGSVKGVRKFECEDKYGAFVRGTNLKVGDYPERDPFASDDEEENDGDAGNGADKALDAVQEEEEEDEDEF
mmetsp:Transcript_17563/g.29447  ORF Transcript_17563/g.29447 Transcript_17563/m.29447 type:complete len:270 (+) Transcript_17563:357-1166(+)